MESENSIVEQIIKELINGVITMDTGQGEVYDQARAMKSHAVKTLVHSMVGMTLEVATTPVSVVANDIDHYSMDSDTSCEERDARQPDVEWDLETKVPRKGYLASMIRRDNNTLEDTPGNRPDKLDVIKIDPCIYETPPNTEKGVEVFVRETGREMPIAHSPA